MMVHKAMGKCLPSLFRGTTNEKKLRTGPLPDPLRFWEGFFLRLPFEMAKSPESGLPHRIAKPHDAAREGFGRNVLETLAFGGTLARRTRVADHAG